MQSGKVNGNNIQRNVGGAVSGILLYIDPSFHWTTQTQGFDAMMIHGLQEPERPWRRDLEPI